MRVLVVPASRHGGTAEIGRAVARTLREEGVDVDVSQPEHMFDVAPYDAYVIGSALYMGRWLDGATRFVEEHAETLTARPTWLFSSGPLGPARPEEPIQPGELRRLMATTSPVEHRLFSGRLEIDRLGRTERFVARWVGAADGDHREWGEIRRWARGIARQVRRLAGTPNVPVPGTGPVL